MISQTSATGCYSFPSPGLLPAAGHHHEVIICIHSSSTLTHGLHPRSLLENLNHDICNVHPPVRRTRATPFDLSYHHLIPSNSVLRARYTRPYPKPMNVQRAEARDEACRQLTYSHRSSRSSSHFNEDHASFVGDHHAYPIGCGCKYDILTGRWT